MEVADALMVTDGVTVSVTLMVIGLEVTVTGLAQGREEVITTVITSPFASVGSV
jgi:hypothetical protein